MFERNDIVGGFCIEDSNTSAILNNLDKRSQVVYMHLFSELCYKMLLNPTSMRARRCVN